MEFTFRFVDLFFKDLFYASPVLGFLLLVIVGLAVLIGRIEGWALPNALYHAFINVTTVGYGDFHPTQGRSRFLCVVLAFVGLIFGGLVVAIAIHAATTAFDEFYLATGILSPQN